MEKISGELNRIVSGTYDEYNGLTEEFTSIKLSGDAWSLKEIIGHLIDSASNNHQRFVRLQIENNLRFPAYHYNWIEIEKYNSMKFSDIILLWKQFNLLLCHIIDTLDKDALSNNWIIDDKTRISLRDLIVDYLRHLKEHIGQFRERCEEVNAKSGL